VQLHVACIGNVIHWNIWCLLTGARLSQYEVVTTLCLHDCRTGIWFPKMAEPFSVPVYLHCLWGPSHLLSSNFHWLLSVKHLCLVPKVKNRAIPQHRDSFVVQSAESGVPTKGDHSLYTGWNWIVDVSQVWTSGVRSCQGTARPQAPPDTPLWPSYCCHQHWALEHLVRLPYHCVMLGILPVLCECMAVVGDLVL
jgi:hypothetical protein